jgi:hypothetical protein
MDVLPCDLKHGDKLWDGHVVDIVAHLTDVDELWLLPDYTVQVVPKDELIRVERAPS